jgi:hypothetical protein
LIVRFQSQSSWVSARNPFSRGRNGTHVVDEDVEAAEAFDRMIDEFGRTGRSRQIDPNGKHVMVGGERVEFGAAVLCASNDRDSFIGEGSGDSQADAFAGAGDDGDLARQVQIHAVLRIPVL